MSYKFAALFLIGSLIGCHPASPSPATPRQAIESKLDLWGEESLHQPGGPSFAFFDKLLPPLRYVDADFHVYPIVLSAPGAAVKARLLSDGSQINALARQPNWRNEDGIPVRIYVGDDRQPFGQIPQQLQGPTLLDGFVPIVHFAYQKDSEEAFVATDPKLADRGAVFARFDLPKTGRIELRFAVGYKFLAGDNGHVVRQADGKVIAAFDDNWDWNKYRSCLTSKPTHASSAYVVIFTQPASPDDLKSLGATFHPQAATKSAEPSIPINEPPAGPPGELVEPKFTDGLTVSITPQLYAQQRQSCSQTWHNLIARGTQIDVPEPYVNNAWRGLVAGSYQTLVGDYLNYSAGNQYARIYVAETGDAVTSLMLLGQPIQPMIKPILQYQRLNMGFHNAGLKLQLLAHYYWITRDAAYINQTRDLWENEVHVILSARDPQTGLLPKEKYCGDIPDLVHSLNSNAICWRGLRDLSAVLREIGQTQQADDLSHTAAVWRKQILAAIAQAENHSTNPPFLPVYPGEAVHDPITATRLGSYWNLISGYMLGSGVFKYDSPTATDDLRYIQTHGGLCMGMLRVQSARSFWAQNDPQNIDDLYGLRYALLLQQRDEPDRALVSFYGKLAQGMTRDTFEDGEATSILPIDSPPDLPGRYVYLPPNSAANANFLQQLRYLLVQDWDMNDDGVPDTLRLCFATPRAWLEPGKRIEMKNATTAFGPVSFSIWRDIGPSGTDTVTAIVNLPNRNLPKRTLLRLRLPIEFRVNHAEVGQLHVGKSFKLETHSLLLLPDHETLDLNGMTGAIFVQAEVIKK